MATPIVIGDILSATLWSELGDQASLNVSGWKCTAIVMAPTVEGFANTFMTDAASFTTPLMTNTANVQGCIAKRLTPAPTPSLFSTLALIAGTAGTNPAPAQSSALITLRSGTVGRKGRGRKYIGFLDDSVMTNAFNLTAAALVNLNLLGTFYGNNYTSNQVGGASATFAPVIINRAAPATSIAITAFVGRAFIATQRRRGAFGRPNPSPF